MTRSSALAQRLRAVFLDGKWIANTNYKGQLTSINLQQALQKIGDLNSIAALTFHVNYYVAGVHRAFEIGVLDIRDKYSFDLPPLRTEVDWHNRVSELLINAEKLAVLVEAMSDNFLNQYFVNEKYGSNLQNIEAIIEHAYYHLGQISLIKKMIVKS
jgi:hypothetical protein